MAYRRDGDNWVYCNDESLSICKPDPGLFAQRGVLAVYRTEREAAKAAPDLLRKTNKWAVWQCLCSNTLCAFLRDIELIEPDATDKKALGALGALTSVESHLIRTEAENAKALLRPTTLWDGRTIEMFAALVCARAPADNLHQPRAKFASSFVFTRLTRNDLMFARPATEFPAARLNDLIGKTILAPIRRGALVRRDNIGADASPKPSEN